MSDVLLDIRGLHKSFAVPVLQNLDLQVKAGEVHALMGSNGAGKSTLCNIVAGVLTANAGEMHFRGQAHAPSSLREAEQSGICMVMQELNLFPTLSIAENLFFKSLGGGAGIVNHHRLQQRSHDLLEKVGLDNLDPATPVSRLGVGQQQLLEIARVLHQPLKLLILDEPTAALTDPQIELLFARIAELKERGCAVLYISHRMDEIRRIADRVSVLRDGRRVATHAVEDIDVEGIIRLMVGEAAEEGHKKVTATSEKNKIMLVENLGRQGAFDDVSFEIRRGEILGIGGLIGSGRTELLRCLFGADRADAGRLRFAHDRFALGYRHDTPAEAIANGVGLVVEDRKAQGLLLPMSIENNIALGQENKLASDLSVMSGTAERRLAKQYIEKLAIKCQHSHQAVSQLSGGNQQKVLIARWLAMDLPILLFDEPTRGVDARAKQAIHYLLKSLVAQGRAVVMVSSESEELLGLSDRILVMSNGRLAGEFSGDEADPERVLQASFRFYSKPSVNPADEQAVVSPSKERSDVI